MNYEDQVLDAIQGIAHGVHKLGLTDAATSMGAIELLALEVKNGSDSIAGALADVAEAIRDASRRPEGVDDLESFLS